ncbi:putative acetyltransferase [Mesorhizobium sp. J18]|uniref:GNAT family N-acetyltransferase n=1 Tax=Mesorhizobium sp. J18 TaxID=935263 RepID=UPI001199B4BE|nr:N-acetyltransferase [Mesorhizobium sp. J18]TWG97465.1 putative acetyltransferase [Mesorhizobium sp. J18]
MSAVIIRPEEPGDEAAIARVVEAAFGNPGEALLIEALRADGDVVLSLVAERDGEIRGHILFSRLFVVKDENRIPAVALAPLAVDPDHQDEGIGTALIDEAHLRLQQKGEDLSVVLGDPDYYGKFGYTHERARDFASNYQGEALQALAWNDTPLEGQLVYPRAFSALS